MYMCDYNENGLSMVCMYVQVKQTGITKEHMIKKTVKCILSNHKVEHIKDGYSLSLCFGWL